MTTTTSAVTTTSNIFETVCTLSDLPENTIKPDRVTYKATEFVKLECQNGFILVGIDQIYCDFNGKFSSFKYTCEAGSTKHFINPKFYIKS